MSIYDLLKSPAYPQKPILEKLVCHRLSFTKEQLFVHMDERISEIDAAWIMDAYSRYTIGKEPVEYILGYVQFVGLQFFVTPETIIPRPETEYMIEAVREFFSSPKKSANEVILLDIGTGSGILGTATLSHAHTYIQKAYLMDRSPTALEVAKKNVDTLLDDEMKNKVTLLTCSLLDHPHLKTLFTTTSEILLVANLPYIPDEMFANNADESITTREPKMAFVGGDDGLDLYRQMFDQILLYRGKMEGQAAKTSPLTPLHQRGEWYEMFEKEQLEKRGLTRVGGHQPYNIHLKERARLMRNNMTAAEKYLWKAYLQTSGNTVNRQKIIDHYIVDFYIAKYRLAIEIDGPTHESDEAKVYDAYRTNILKNYGVRIVRFSNEDVLYNLDEVVKKLEEAYTLPLISSIQPQHNKPIDPSLGKKEDDQSVSTHTSASNLYSSPLGKRGARGDSLTMFLEMMTRQGKILADEYQAYRTFEEVKTFHANIVILKVMAK